MEQIYYKGSNGTEYLVLEKPEDFYFLVGSKIAKQENGKKLRVVAGLDDFEYVVFQVSVRSGTQNITPVKNTMPPQYLGAMEEKYLAFIDRDRNSYKYYHMIPGGDKVIVEYGRCTLASGQFAGARKTEWSIEMYPIKLCEKLGKGYVDISEYMLAEDTTTFNASAKKTASSELFETLHNFAKSFVKEKVNAPVNTKIIAKSRELIDEMREFALQDNLEEFNRVLLFLMLIMQRKIPTGNGGKGVENNLAHKSDDYGAILTRETELCDAMEGSLIGKTEKQDFSMYGITVRYATEKQKEFVKGLLIPSLKPKVKNIYRVIPHEQKKKFEEYSKNIKQFKYFWHGSKNENWASIIKNGLLLNPNAVITGKMFGYGIYFADPGKGYQYTSVHESKWAHGTSDTGFMGLYKTAYGTPYDVTVHSGMDYENHVKKNGFNCLHAHKGRLLLADEIVFYDESAMVLEYIVEFAA